MRFSYYKVSDDGDVDVYMGCAGSSEVQPWVKVRDSLMMANHLQLKGKGLYACQPFQADQRLGKYTGRLMALATDRDSLVSSSDKLLTCRGIIVDGDQPPQSRRAQQSRCGKSLFDPGEYPGMHHFRANDARNTPMQNNCLVDHQGYMIAVRPIEAVFQDGGCPETNAKSELLWSYGDTYWNQ